jgi:molybdopterin-guanine dinucleotide biosynthesis protein A
MTGRTTTSRIGVIVLAGGRSSRFGTDKLAQPLAGRPLLHHAIDAVRAIAPEAEVVVVTSPDGRPDVPNGVTVARDATAFEGPLAGLVAGLSALPPEIERLLVVGGDMPTLVPAVLGRLLAAAEDEAVELAALDDGGLARPLPMALRRASAERAALTLLAAGERRLRALAGALASVTIAERDWRAIDAVGATLRDVDVPEDLG